MNIPALSRAIALGRIGTAEANKALASAKARPAVAAVVADASLSCAEKLLASGRGKDANSFYMTTFFQWRLYRIQTTRRGHYFE